MKIEFTGSCALVTYLNSNSKWQMVWWRLKSSTSWTLNTVLCWFNFMSPSAGNNWHWLFYKSGLMGWHLKQNNHLNKVIWFESRLLIWWIRFGCNSVSGHQIKCLWHIHTEMKSHHFDEFSSIATLEVVILTTSSAASDENFIKMNTFPFSLVRLLIWMLPPFRPMDGSCNWYIIY